MKIGRMNIEEECINCAVRIRSLMKHKFRMFWLKNDPKIEETK